MRRAPGHNRAAILAAGYETIATMGYARATTAQIARQAGVSSGTFFHYFPTKEDLLLALLDPDDEPGTDDAAGEHDSVTALVDEALAELADPLLPVFAREVATLVGLPRVEAAVRRQVDRRQSAILDAIRADQERGVVDPARDAYLLGMQVAMALDGAESLRASRPDLDPQTVVDAARGLVRSALGGLGG